MKHIREIKGETKSSGLVDALYKETSYGETANGALTFTRSGSSLLDFFAQGGAMRGNPKKAIELFSKAFSEDRTLAIRILFYLRDVRGGQGERDLFRNCLEWIGTNYPDIFEKIVSYVPEYGRWDDMFFDNEYALKKIKHQLAEDLKSQEPSLLAKWLPTINASSSHTKAKARFIAQKIGMREIEYRKNVRSLREKLKVVEEKMSARKWGEIEYSRVPSQASRIYKNAFTKHDEERYGKYLEKVESGEEKINASTLYPYQIYKSAEKDYSKTLDLLWKNLPDYTMGKEGIVVADVSGSMEGNPMAVAVSLALYFAERNSGPFKNHFITFSEEPKFQRIQGQTLKEKMASIENSEWGYKTNIQRVFSLILNAGIQYHIKQEEMPETVYIISDMEFDACDTGKTNYEEIKEKYRLAGYEVPNLVFWNVNASGENLPVQKDEVGVSLVSGFSPTVFKMAVENKTPEQVMLDTINSNRYNVINIWTN